MNIVCNSRLRRNEMNININVKRKYKINGKEYNSIEEMPEDIRKAFEKAMISKDGKSSQTTTKMQNKIMFNGIEYESIDAMPQDVRQLYKEVMKTVETRVTSPENVLEAKVDFSLTKSKDSRTGMAGTFSQPIKPEPIFSSRKLIVGIIFLALIILLYFLFHNR
jgi:cobalamin biosynthesis Co2+ chelatase CbiK